MQKECLSLSPETVVTHAAPVDEWDLPADQYVAKIKAGWNYGNGLEDNNVSGYYDTNYYTDSNPSGWHNCKFNGYPTDCYGNTVTDPKVWETTMSYSAQWPLTKQLLATVHDAGFDALRLPCTWFNWTDYDSGPFTLGNGVVCSGDKITAAYLERVKEIVDWACELKMYVIINMHHDDSIWLRVDTYNEHNWNFTKTRYENLWKQIAYYFKDYGSNVMFAGMNEIVWGETTAFWEYNEMRTTQANCDAHMGELYQLFVDTVRATRGNNTKRYLCIAPMGAIAWRQNEMILPKDPKSSGGINRIIVEVHEYVAFYKENAGYKWNLIFAQAGPRKQLGYGLLIGEGAFKDATTNTDNTPRSRESFEMHTLARAYGVPIFQWDNGGIGGMKSSLNRLRPGAESKPGYLEKQEVWSLLQRRDGAWRFPKQIAAIMHNAYDERDIVSAPGQPDYYYWKEETYCKVALHKGLFAGKAWKAGGYTPDGKIDTTAAGSVYMEPVAVQPGAEYTLRNNVYSGDSSPFFFSVYGLKSDGTAVCLKAGRKAKGLQYLLMNLADPDAGQAVDISKAFDKDVVFTVPDDVTALAVSIHGADQPWVEAKHLLSAIEATALNPALLIGETPVYHNA